MNGRYQYDITMKIDNHKWIRKEIHTFQENVMRRVKSKLCINKRASNSKRTVNT